jgi:thiamine-phosphate pyrophosphorylase
MIAGLYAVTPDEPDTASLLARTGALLAAGTRLLQYRNKSAPPALRLEQARALRALCDRYGARLIVNDSVELALAVGADGVHLGRADGSVAEARARLGASLRVGASCYDRFDLATRALADGADHVAFGSVYPSAIKPDAVRAPLELIRRARRELPVPVVAIGGITPENAAPVVAAGAHALAVISALYGAADPAAAVRAYARLFPWHGSPA